MKTNRPISYFVLLLCAAICIGSSSGQTNQPAGIPPPPAVLANGDPTAAVVFPNGQAVTMRSRKNLFPLVGVAASQNANVQLRFPPAFVALAMGAQALDGGTISATPPGLTVAANGTASLQFQPGVQPGMYRVLLDLHGVLVTLRFWVPDPDNPYNPVTL